MRTLHLALPSALLLVASVAGTSAWAEFEGTYATREPGQSYECTHYVPSFFGERDQVVAQVRDDEFFMLSEPPVFDDDAKREIIALGIRERYARSGLATHRWLVGGWAHVWHGPRTDIPPRRFEVAKVEAPLRDRGIPVPGFDNLLGFVTLDDGDSCVEISEAFIPQPGERPWISDPDGTVQEGPWLDQTESLRAGNAEWVDGMIAALREFEPPLVAPDFGRAPWRWKVREGVLSFTVWEPAEEGGRHYRTVYVTNRERAQPDPCKVLPLGAPAAAPLRECKKLGSTSSEQPIFEAIWAGRSETRAYSTIIGELQIRAFHNVYDQRGLPQSRSYSLEEFNQFLASLQPITVDELLQKPRASN